MTACNAEMPSYTYAVKAEKLLRARGYACNIRRNDNAAADGCGYTLDIYGNCRMAKEILNKYAVPYKNFYAEAVK